MASSAPASNSTSEAESTAATSSKQTTTASAATTTNASSTAAIPISPSDLDGAEYAAFRHHTRLRAVAYSCHAAKLGGAWYRGAGHSADLVYYVDTIDRVFVFESSTAHSKFELGGSTPSDSSNTTTTTTSSTPATTTTCVDLAAIGCGEWDKTKRVICLPAVANWLMPSAREAVKAVGRPGADLETFCYEYELHIEADKLDEELPEIAIDPAVAVPCTITTDDDVHTVDDHWKFKYPGSEAQLRNLVKAWPSAGMRDPATGQLLAWIVTRDDSAMGLLYVRPEHRRKGLARACAVALCRALIKRGWTPLVHIEKSNAASTALFTSLGFKVTREVSWLVCFPRAPKHEAWTKKAFGLGEEGSSTATASDSTTGSS